MESKIKVGILGLGLIGSSILRKLARNSSYELFVFSNSSYSKAKEYTENSSNDINILKKSDLVFVCSRVSQTLEYLSVLNNILPKDTVVADVTSIKKDLLNTNYNFNFILSHPMAGTECTGFDSGFADLFLGSKWLIEKENDLLIKVINDLGANPIKVDMKNHDKMCAQISHLTTILSFLIYKNANLDALKIASSGFRDMTRLAVTNSDLAVNMLNLNIENIDNEFKNLVKLFDDLKKMSDDEKIKLFEELSNKRAQMYDKSGKNIL